VVSQATGREENEANEPADQAATRRTALMTEPRPLIPARSIAMTKGLLETSLPSVEFKRRSSS
jgi:hypothetical protein